MIAQSFSEFIHEDMNFFKEGRLQRRQANLGVTIGVTSLNEEELKANKGSSIWQIKIKRADTDNGTQGLNNKLNARKRGENDTSIRLV